MLTKKVKKRFSFLGIFLTVSLISIFFILKFLNENILYFKSPTDINSAQDIKLGKKIRIGGMVKKNSLKIEKKEIKKFSLPIEFLLNTMKIICLQN